MEKLDFKSLAIQIIRAARGDKSQNFLNLALGSSFNVVAKWENARKRISWNEFVNICEVLDLPLDNALNYGCFYNGDIRDCGKLFGHISSGKSSAEVSNDLGISKSKALRRINGEKLLLEEMLSGMHYYFSIRFWVFIKSLNLSGEIDCESSDIEIIKQLSDITDEHPSSDILVPYLNTVEYKNMASHKAGFLATCTDIGTEEENKMLNSLESAGIIYFEDGKFIERHGDITHHDDFESSKKRFRYIFEQSLESLNAEKEEHHHTKNRRYCTFDCDPDTEKKLIALTDNFYKEFLNIMSKRDQEKSDKVLAFCLHLFDTDKRKD
ncbi:MAG: hypothetical protein HOE90_03740 [Bacteriovoracaceae bacterium]|jgi:hypothetical protein|nr:hypothetical protein [Bacteriovoracaceae bacterium]